MVHPSTPPPSKAISPIEPSASIEKAAEQPRPSRPRPVRPETRPRMAGARMAAVRPPTWGVWP
eukprot:196242-Prymnesium_polylepis.1